MQTGPTRFGKHLSINISNVILCRFYNRAVSFPARLLCCVSKDRTRMFRTTSFTQTLINRRKGKMRHIHLMEY
jgi:hypothetical protein